MKQKTLIQLRDEDFIDSLRSTMRRLKRERRFAAPSQIIAEALASRPRRYYLSYTTVATRLMRLRNSGQLKISGSGKVSLAVRQWADINSAVDRYLCRHKRATIGEAISYVVAFDRPCRFYISDKKARELFRGVSRPTYSIAD